MTTAGASADSPWFSQPLGGNVSPSVGGAYSSPPSPDGLVASGLVKSYGDVRAVRKFDIHIAPGETVAILGPNGAGKSTTIDMLLGLATPDAGSVSVFGSAPSQATAAGLVGAMLQTGGLLRQMSVGELIAMMARLYPNPMPVDQVLRTAGISDIAGRRTHKLSGGQTQRVRFAMALVGNPKFLVLDEPTASLDIEGRREFWDAVRNFSSTGSTVVFATHYLEEADAFSDRIVLMARGLVVADGPVAEIKARVGLRTIRATVPEMTGDALAALPGVSSVDLRGDVAVLACKDSDTALHALLRTCPAAHGVEVRGAGLEEAFLLLTADQPEMET